MTSRYLGALVALLLCSCTELDPGRTSGAGAHLASDVVALDEPTAIKCGDGVTVGFDEAERDVVARGISWTGDAEEAERACNLAPWTSTAFACDSSDCRRGCFCDMTVDDESMEYETDCQFESMYMGMIAFKKTGRLSPGQHLSCSACASAETEVER